jgi:hypothetical protein
MKKKVIAALVAGAMAVSSMSFIAGAAEIAPISAQLGVVWSEDFAEIPAGANNRDFDWVMIPRPEVGVGPHGSTAAITEMAGQGGTRGFVKRFAGDAAITGEVVSFTFDVQFGPVAGSRNIAAIVIGGSEEYVNNAGSLPAHDTIFSIYKTAVDVGGYLYFGVGQLVPVRPNYDEVAPIAGHTRIAAPGFEVDNTWFTVGLSLNFVAGTADLHMTNLTTNYRFVQTDIPLGDTPTQVEVFGFIAYRAGAPNDASVATNAGLANVQIAVDVAPAPYVPYVPYVPYEPVTPEVPVITGEPVVSDVALAQRLLLVFNSNLLSFLR